MAIVQIVKLTENAVVPVRATAGSAGLDLFAAYDTIIPPRGVEMIKTDIQIKCPEKTYGRIAPRSGLALRQITVGGGVIDGDFRGNLGVILFNHGRQDFLVRRGDRIAQIIFERFEQASVWLCTTLDATDRGSGGFGSTLMREVP